MRQDTESIDRWKDLGYYSREVIQMPAKSAQREETINNVSWAILKQMAPSNFAVFIAVLTHPVDLIRLMRNGAALKKQAGSTKGKERQIPYVIPSYREGMRHSKSGEVNLRPTYQCESNAPEIIAMANELGAFQKSDREYAEVCFNFLKKKVDFSFSAPVRGALKTLQTGHGICFDKVSLFIALCRAGGIPARYKMYNEAFTQPIYENFASANPIMKAWYDSTGYFVAHTMAEAFIDGKWLPADFAIPPDFEAALGMPLGHFGEEPEGIWNWEIPGSAVRFEQIPRSFAFGMNLSMKFMAITQVMAVVNSEWEVGRQKGQKILEDMGEEGYDKSVRQTYKAVLPSVSRKLFDALKDADEEAKPALGREGAKS
jgi:Transglutaminase-like superfamily